MAELSRAVLIMRSIGSCIWTNHCKVTARDFQTCFSIAKSLARAWAGRKNAVEPDLQKWNARTAKNDNQTTSILAVRAFYFCGSVSTAATCSAVYSLSSKAWALWSGPELRSLGSGMGNPLPASRPPLAPGAHTRLLSVTVGKKSWLFQHNYYSF